MKRFVLLVLLLGSAAAAVCYAQFGRRWRQERDTPDVYDEASGQYLPDPTRYLWDRRGIPDWTPSKDMSKDVFTFVRIEYESQYGRSRWRTDFPDSDLNLSFRLQELTSIEVNNTPIVLDLNDPRIFDYPFIYMLEPGDIYFSDQEAANLRKYLLNGGFLMVDDFWGDWEWEGFYREFKKVFPDRDAEELEISHPIFHIVFDLKEKPQIPSLENAMMGRSAGITWEPKPGAEHVHYKAVYDDEGRMVCIICHNTDLGDGWEREGDNHWYFKEFSEKRAYPMGINIIFWALTH